LVSGVVEFNTHDVAPSPEKPGLTEVRRAGTDSLLDACDYVRTLEHRQGLKVGIPKEVAWRMGFIDDQLAPRAHTLLKSGYGSYLLQLLKRR
jgi:dTDP-glucose pyrophosphorylase